MFVDTRRQIRLLDKFDSCDQSLGGILVYFSNYLFFLVFGRQVEPMDAFMHSEH